MTLNPYQAPLADSFQLNQTEAPSQFIPSRLEFKGELTRQHHRDAVIKAGIRKEYRGTTRVIFSLACLFTLFTGVYLVASGNANIAPMFFSTLLFLGGVAIFCRQQRWLIGTRIPSFQLAVGPIQGWIDPNGLWIETQHSQAYCPLSMLVSSAATHDLWALSFAKDQTFWQTLPIDSFRQPSLARSAASDLQRAFPPLAAQILDERKRTIPNEPFLFVATGAAILFEGNFYEDAADGTRLLKATHQVMRKTWLTLAILLGSILVSLLVLTGLRPLYVGLALLWVAFLIANVFFQVWRVRRKAFQKGRAIAWYSKGWLDDEGYCAMTALGQTKATWKFFDHFEITDDAIGLYPHEMDVCCCLVAREQFASDADWNRATELVRKNMVA